MAPGACVSIGNPNGSVRGMAEAADGRAQRTSRQALRVRSRAPPPPPSVPLDENVALPEILLSVTNELSFAASSTMIWPDNLELPLMSSCSCTRIAPSTVNGILSLPLIFRSPSVTNISSGVSGVRSGLPLISIESSAMIVRARGLPGLPGLPEIVAGPST